MTPSWPFESHVIFTHKPAKVSFFFIYATWQLSVLLKLICLGCTITSCSFQGRSRPKVSFPAFSLKKYFPWINCLMYALSCKHVSNLQQPKVVFVGIFHLQIPSFLLLFS